MSKTKSRRARRTSRETTKHVDVMSQFSTAFANPAAAAVGAAIGGIVPWFAREVAHGELAAQWGSDRTMAVVDLVIVLGCVLFSMTTVYGFGRAAFGNARKAAGFVMALEGVMLVTHGNIALVALVVLVTINAVTTGCVIALAHDKTNRRRADDQRRSATRASNRAVRASAVRPARVDASTDSVVDAEVVSYTPAPTAARGRGHVRLVAS